jgi:hypothetical protein
MKPTYSKLLIISSAFSLTLLIAFATQAAEQVSFSYDRIFIEAQAVELRKSDGSIANAKFLSEIIVLKDGRANGGFGILERGAVETLSFYRVTQGKKTGASFTFKGQRLYPLPSSEITVRLYWPQGQAPTGSVTFFVDGITPSVGNPLSLVANGTLATGSGPINLIDSEFNFVFLNSPPQTVEIATVTDLIISPFNSAALIFPTVGLIGSLELTSPARQPVRYHYGPGVYKTTNGGQTWMVMAMAENSLIPGDGIMVMVRPHPDPSEPCRIYDIAGTQVPSLQHFEAETLVTSFKFER